VLYQWTQASSDNIIITITITIVSALNLRPPNNVAHPGLVMASFQPDIMKFDALQGSVVVISGTPPTASVWRCKQRLHP